jgi:serine/threonine-protein kinase
VVYRGRDRHLGRELAIKVLRDDYRDRPEARRRFIAEARVGSQLQHPAIVPVYEQGQFADGRPYFTMKLVEGHTLAALLRDRADPGHDRARLVGVFEQVCQAMAYAHARGVVHRDLKPANVMVGAFGEVQVMDWGFAKQLRLPESNSPCTASDLQSASIGASQSGMMMGTPAYMPPEQARGESAHIDVRADVFALGAILCEILTGRPPYVGHAVNDVWRQATSGDLRDAHTRLDACGVDAALRDLAKHCLTADRTARPADAGVVAQDLTDHLASAQERLRHAQVERVAAEVRAQEAGAKAKAERRARRSAVALAAAAVVLLAAAGSAWRWYEQVKQSRAHQMSATDGKIEAALTEAANWLNQRDWRQAQAAATRARELYESGASKHGRERIDEQLADATLATQIDEIRLLQTDYDYIGKRFHRERAIPRFAEAFARYGVRPGSDPAGVAAAIAQRPAPVRDVLVAGLENWWLLADGHQDADREWLWAVLQAVDADPVRTQIRRAVVKDDRPELEGLAAQVNGADVPLVTVSELAAVLLNYQDFDAVIALLRPVQRRYPDDFWINIYLAWALDLRQPHDQTEALRFLSIAQALRPAAVRYDHLSSLLRRQKDVDGAVVAARKAIELSPGDGSTHGQLGSALIDQGNWTQAETALRKAMELDPTLASPHYNLGILFRRRGQVDEAIAEYRKAIRLAPDQAEYHNNLGNALHARKDFDAALTEFAKALELNPRLVQAHVSRGRTLMTKGRVDEAIAEYETAIRLDPTHDMAHGNLGGAWQRKGRFDRAVAASLRAIELNPRFAGHYYNLGHALQSVSDANGAIAAYNKAIELDPNDAETHCNLRQVLQDQGRFAEALAEIEQGHRLGSAQPDWGYPSAQWLKETQRLVALDAKLLGILDGSAKPANVAEQLEFAWVCKLKGRYGAAARLYTDAFRTRPSPATSEPWYRATCVAALAGCGQGTDAPAPDSAERARWRKQALDWLRAGLSFWADPRDIRPNKQIAAVNAVRRWRAEKAFAGLREPEDLAKLPESERAEWLRFWADAQELFVRSLAKVD